MTLYEILHAPTKPAWTARLVAYLACVVTLVTFVQILVWLLG